MRVRSSSLALVVPTVTALALGGCGDAGGARGPEEPITARAIAAVALDHLPDDTDSRQATYVDRTFPQGYVGADLRYGAGEGDDGDLVQVTVLPDEPLPRCADTEAYDGCVELSDTVVLGWDEVEPEEDPGIVVVWTERDGATVAALTAGPEISGDPREQSDLEPSVDTLVELVSDDRLAPVVAASTIAAGEALGDWDGGERESGELDDVPQTAAGLVGTFMLGRGDGWTYEGPSPVAADLGEGAVGGRTTGYRDGPIGPGVLDVAAVPRMPTWAEPSTCREGWSCWAKGDTRVVWRPASGEDPGESWLLQPAELGGVAGLHVQGRRMPVERKEVRYFSGFVLYAASLTDPIEPQALGTTTDRGGLEQAEALAAEHQSG